MYKGLTCFLLLSACASSKFATESWKGKYPYGLIGDSDYGILNEEDFAINVSRVETPKPISPTSTVYPYWQCFPTKGMAFLCDIIVSTKEKPNAILAIVAEGKDRNQEYLSRLVIDLRSCQETERIWKRATAGQQYVCLSGPFVRYSEDEMGKRMAVFVLDKFKTKKECVPYFESCDLKKK